MKRAFAALALGAAAGVVDVLPMLAIQTDTWAMISAFLHWLFLGVVLVYLDWQLAGWLKGLIISLFAALSVVTMVYPVDPVSVGPILGMSVVLGLLVGAASDRINRWARG
ncbi:MAG: hypothetical protein ACM3QZ_13705 [Solirubrobacterales bacterium]